LPARSLFVCRLLDRAAGDSSDGYGSVAALLDSEFGDPRLLPMSEGWRTVERFDEKAFGAFLVTLNKQDLAFFFEHAMKEPRRRDFWLRYVHRMRHTTCILASSTFADLRTRLEGGNEAATAVLRRARKFASGSNQTSAFCMYFERIVVVEFSEVGHAAYVFERDLFERSVAPAIAANRIRTPSDIKSHPNRARINHAQRWEGRAHEVLQSEGVIGQFRGGVW
jgi:hypothetical protein